MADYTVGIDIGESAIKAVTVSKSFKGGYKVMASAIVYLNEHENLETAIKSLWENEAFHHGPCIVNFPARDVSFRHIKLPFTERKKIDQTLAFELESQIPFPLDNAIFDYLVTFREGQGEVFAAILEKDAIIERIRMLESSFKRVAVIDIETFPMISCLLDRKGLKGSGLLLDMGHTGTKGIFFSAGRVLQVRLFCPPLKDGGTAEEALSALPGEIRNTVGYLQWTGELPADLAEIYVTGGGATDETCRQHLSESLGLPVIPLDVADLTSVKMDETLRSTWQPLLMNQALALAVHPSSKKSNGFNFRPLVLQDHKIKYVGLLKNMKWVAAAMAVCLLLGLTEYYLDYVLTRARVLRLKSEITAVFKKSAPEVQTIVDPVQQLNTKIQETRKVALVLRGMTSDNTVLDILRDISILTPSSAQFSLQSLTYDNNRLVLRGEAENYDMVDAIKKELGKSRYFSTVTISSSGTAKQGSKVEFEMHITTKARL